MGLWGWDIMWANDMSSESEVGKEKIVWMSTNDQRMPAWGLISNTATLALAQLAWLSG